MWVHGPESVSPFQRRHTCAWRSWLCASDYLFFSRQEACGDCLGNLSGREGAKKQGEGTDRLRMHSGGLFANGRSLQISLETLARGCNRTRKDYETPVYRWMRVRRDSLRVYC